MKIKATNNSVKFDSLPLIMLVFSVVLAAVRTVQMFFFIDHKTGFYLPSSFSLGFTNVMLYGGIVLFFIIFAVIAFISESSNGISLQGIKDKTVGAFAAIFSLALFFDFVKCITYSVEISSDDTFQSLMIDGVIQTKFRGIFALLSAIYFIFIAKDYFTGGESASEHKLLAFSPFGWVAFRLVNCFIKKISFVQVSDLLLELLMLVLMMMFFVAFAGTASGVYKIEYRWRIIAFGAPSALIAFSVSIARLVFTFVRGVEEINPTYRFNIVDLAFFAFVFVLVYSISKGNGEKTYDENEELQEMTEYEQAMKREKEKSSKKIKKEN